MRRASPCAGPASARAYVAAVDYAFWGLVAAVIVFAFLPRILGAKHRIAGADARARVKNGAILLDVRTPGEFAGGHLPGAKNIPLDALSSRMGELAKDRPIVAYCRSGMRAASAVRLLRREGFEAWNLGPKSAW